MYTCIYVCMHVYMYICSYNHIIMCKYICINVYIYIYIHIYIYISIWVCEAYITYMSAYLCSSQCTSLQWSTASWQAKALAVTSALRLLQVSRTEWHSPAAFLSLFHASTTFASLPGCHPLDAQHSFCGNAWEALPLTMSGILRNVQSLMEEQSTLHLKP